MTFGATIGIICILVTAMLLVKNFDKGAMFYIIFSLTSPVVFNFTFELICFPILLVGCFLTRNGRVAVYRKFEFSDTALMLYFIIGILSTLVSGLKNSVPMGVIGLFGVARIVILAMLFKSVFRDNFSYKLKFIINIVIWTNIVACIIQLAIPQSVHMFHDFYYRTGNTPLDSVVNLGYFNRLYGTFSTPISLAILFDMGFAVSFFKWYKVRSFAICDFLTMAIIVILGVFTYSKTFYFAVPIIIFSTILLCGLKSYNINYLSKFSTLLIALTLLIIILVIAAKDNVILSYYLSYFKNPMKIFDTRYGENGNLLELKKVIKGNFLFGIGQTNISGEFVGDSAYYSALHFSGLVGTLLYLSALLYGFLKSYKTENIIGCLFVIIILICGTALPTFDMIFASITFGMSCSQNSKKKYKKIAKMKEVITGSDVVKAHVAKS